MSARTPIREVPYRLPQRDSRPLRRVSPASRPGRESFWNRHASDRRAAHPRIDLLPAPPPMCTHDQRSTITPSAATLRVIRKLGPRGGGAQAGTPAGPWTGQGRPGRHRGTSMDTTSRDPIGATGWIQPGRDKKEAGGTRHKSGASPGALDNTRNFACMSNKCGSVP